MKLHSATPLGAPGLPIQDVIDWLQWHLDHGFTEIARVKVGKTTGQKPVIIINEDRDAPIPLSLPKPWVPTMPTKTPVMWPDIEEREG